MLANILSLFKFTIYTVSTRNMHGAFSDFLHSLDQARERLRCSRSGAFFRGHSHSDYSLVPTLLRNKIDQETEHNFYSECYARARRLMPENTNSWEFLSHMQHYGIPTRLLDWTESLASAIFFALSGKPTDPCIWVTNAYTLNRAAGTSKKPQIIVPGIDPFPDYFKCFVLHEDQEQEEWPYKLPVFLDIPWASDRIIAQKGFFTFHSTDTPLDQAAPEFAEKVPIPNAAISGAWSFLESAGVNEYTIFADLEGLARHLKKRYIH